MTVGPSEKMSKSKKNVVAPMGMIDIYGADAIRFFMLSDSPPERDVDWSESGVEGCWRFVSRVWRLVDEAKDLPPPGTVPAAGDEVSKALRQATHRAITAVTDHLAALRFNSAVAQLYTLANAIQDGAAASGAARREALEALVLLAAPMMPHLAESCWQALGHDKLVAETAWPRFDPTLVVSDSVTIAVQVNGKRRGEVTVAKAADNASVEKDALALDAVIRALEGKTAEEGDRGPRPYREHCCMNRAVAIAARFARCSRAAAFIPCMAARWRRSLPPSMSSRWPTATAMNCAMS